MRAPRQKGERFESNPLLPAPRAHALEHDHARLRRADKSPARISSAIEFLTAILHANSAHSQARCPRMRAGATKAPPRPELPNSTPLMLSPCLKTVSKLQH